MYAIHLHIHTTVGFALSAGNALATMEVRFYRYHFTHLKTLPRRNVQHISGYFMTKDAWVFEIRLHALKSVDVGATDADLSNIPQCFGRIGCGLIRLDELDRQSTRLDFSH